MRKAYCAGTGNRLKPSVLVGKDYSLWIGNETTGELKLDASEICGFNLGSFESKAIAGILTVMGINLHSLKRTRLVLHTTCPILFRECRAQYVSQQLRYGRSRTIGSLLSI